jgi:hypothetical protein
MFYFPFDYYHLNQARTQTLSVLLGPGRVGRGPRNRPGPVHTSTAEFSTALKKCTARFVTKRGVAVVRLNTSVQRTVNTRMESGQNEQDCDL